MRERREWSPYPLGGPGHRRGQRFAGVRGESRRNSSRGKPVQFGAVRPIGDDRLRTHSAGTSRSNNESCSAAEPYGPLPDQWGPDGRFDPKHAKGRALDGRPSSRSPLRTSCGRYPQQRTRLCPRYLHFDAVQCTRPCRHFSRSAAYSDLSGGDTRCISNRLLGPTRRSVAARRYLSPKEPPQRPPERQ